MPMQTTFERGITGASSFASASGIRSPVVSKPWNMGSPASTTRSSSSTMPNCGSLPPEVNRAIFTRRAYGPGRARPTGRDLPGACTDPLMSAEYEDAGAARGACARRRPAAADGRTDGVRVHGAVLRGAEDVRSVAVRSRGGAGDRGRAAREVPRPHARGPAPRPAPGEARLDPLERRAAAAHAGRAEDDCRRSARARGRVRVHGDGVGADEAARD